MATCGCGCGQEVARSFVKGHSRRKPRAYSPEGQVEAKTCFDCGEMKPLSEYYGHPIMADGHLSNCKDCKRGYQRGRHAVLKDDPEHRVARARWARKRRLRSYGLTDEEYGTLLAEQGGRCAICGTAEPGRGSILFPIDHDHETGEVRGLLCHDCNLGIGRLADDPDRLLAAAAYLLARQNVLGQVFL